MSTLSMYQDFVRSRAKPGYQIIADCGSKGLDNHMNRLHGVIGLITELDEIQFAEDEENLVEELGDYYFYLTLLEMNVGEDYQFSSTPADVDWEGARHFAAVLLDLSKKEVIYAKELNQEQIHNFQELTANMRGYFHFVLHQLDMTEAEIQAHNMAKLEKRYPTGYSNEAAAARADKEIGQ